MEQNDESVKQSGKRNAAVLPMVSSVTTKTDLKIAPWAKAMKHKEIFDGLPAEEKASAIDYITSQLRDYIPKPNIFDEVTATTWGKFEFPVHMRHIGYAIGLKQGQPMPKSLFRVRNADGKMVWNGAGIREVNDLLGRYEAIDPEHYYSIIPLLDVENHPDRIWRLLTDTYKLGGKLKYGTNN